MEMEYANKGVAGAGLGLGIAGTALGLMAGGLNGTGLFNTGCARNVSGCGCSEDHVVNRYELGLQQELAAKDSKISLLESNIYVDGKIADVYERLNTKIGVLEHELCDQRVYNATNTATVSCLQQQIATLAALTKVVVPITNVCPQPAVATTPAAG